MSNLDKGSFRAQAVIGTATLGVSSKGTDQVGVEIEILEGPGAGEKKTWYGYFTEATAQRTVESLKHMGWSGVWGELAETVGTKECVAVLDWETYNGVESLKVQWINAAGGVAMKQTMDAGSRAAFEARMKSTVAGVFGGAPAKPAPRAAAPQRPAPQGRPASPPPPSQSNEPEDQLDF